MKTYKTKDQAKKDSNYNINSHGYNGVIYELYCNECGNTFYSVGFSKYRKAECNCGEDTNGMVIIKNQIK